MKVGKKILELSKEEKTDELHALIDINYEIMPLMVLYGTEAFEDLLGLRYNTTIEFYLQRGMSLANSFPSCLIHLVMTSRFLKEDPPVETLRLLLKYGADPN